MPPEPCCALCTSYTAQASHRGVCALWKERRAMWGIVMPEFGCTRFKDAKRDVQRAAEKVEQDRQSEI